MNSKRIHLTIVCIAVLALAVVVVAQAAKGGSGKKASQGTISLLPPSGATNLSVGGNATLAVTGTSKGKVYGTIDSTCTGLTAASVWATLYDSHGALQTYGGSWQLDGSVKFDGDWVSGKSLPTTFVVWESVGTQDYEVLRGTVVWQ